MTWVWFVPVTIVGSVVLGVGVLAIVLRLSWHPHTRAYPAQTPAADAVRRNFQSYRIGLLNLTCMIHTAVDDRFLHLMPAKLLRWLGAQPFSVPWSSIRILKRSRIGDWIAAEVDGRRIFGPAWCLKLADPGEGDEASS